MEANTTKVFVAPESGVYSFTYKNNDKAIIFLDEGEDKVCVDAQLLYTCTYDEFVPHHAPVFDLIVDYYAHLKKRNTEEIKDE